MRSQRTRMNALCVCRPAALFPQLIPAPPHGLRIGLRVLAAGGPLGNEHHIGAQGARRSHRRAGSRRHWACRAATWPFFTRCWTTTAGRALIERRGRCSMVRGYCASRLGGRGTRARDVQTKKESNEFPRPTPSTTAGLRYLPRPLGRRRRLPSCGQLSTCSP